MMPCMFSRTFAARSQGLNPLTQETNPYGLKCVFLLKRKPYSQ